MTALTKDQVNPMLYGTHNVSTRTIFKLTAMLLLLFVGGVGAVFAAGNTGAPPQLVPFQMNLLAGNPYVFQPGLAPGIGNGAGGFSGEGLVGSAGGSATNSPQVLTSDSVDNVFFADANNAVIREINAVTGVVTTVVGVPPTGCSSTGQGCHPVTGCADGVVANSPIEANLQGVAIDSYGNLYFDDTTTNTISVVYRGGTLVANFIKLVNPAAVTTAGGVLPGYVYHVAGTIAIANCLGTSSKASTATTAAIPAGDGNLAYNSGVTFSNIGSLSLDSAGNLYVGDGGINNTIRVINTQAVAQTFFGIKVQPGFIASIANCGPLTNLCPPNAGNSPVTEANTGIGGPPESAVFNTLATGQGQWMNVDAYGNLYELNYKGATPAICPCMAVAYAGGTALGNLIVQANKLSSITNVPSLTTATPGDFYYMLQTLTLRPGSITQDGVGNLYYEDNHYGQIYRIDINSVAYATNWLGSATILEAGNQINRNAPIATVVTPAFCYGTGSGFAPSTTTPTLTGQQTTDIYGDGCPAALANGIGNPHASGGFGSASADGIGNVFIANKQNNLVQEVALNNRFPATPVGKSYQQTIQIHFDSSNLPVQIAATVAPVITTSSIAVAAGSTDFSINPIDTIATTSTASVFVISGASTPAVSTTVLTGNVGLPPCANTTGSVDKSVDCVVNVIFTPTAGGVRTSQLVVTTANGSVYNFGLTGIGTGGQLAIDGGAQTVVPFAGLGNTGQVAVGATGTVYVADPTNNRIAVLTNGVQSTVGTGLKSPMGVAVDTYGNVYIADTGNNRVVEVSEATGAQTVLGQVVAVGTPAYPQYTFKGPQAVAVDVNGNVYVADTGNGVVVEIPENPVLGGATPLLQFTGAPTTIKKPVSLALDSAGNLYVADTTFFQALQIPAGGGDPQDPILPTLRGFGGVAKNSSGVAVDGAGNVYVSGLDSNGASQVYEAGAASGPTGQEFQLNFANTVATNFTGNAPAAASFSGGAIALDANGNLYVSDSGNSRVLFYNRQNPTVSFGLLAQDQPAASAVLTLTNTGTGPVTVPAAYATITSTTPSGNTAFNIVPTPTGTSAQPTVPCTTAGVLVPGGHCTFSATFLPTTDGAQSATVSIGGSTQTVSLTGTGVQPDAAIVLSVTAPAGGAVVGSPATVTATVTQPNIPGVTPTGTVAFTYTIQGDGINGSLTPTLTSVSAGTATATLTLPTLLQGRRYTINATYSGDAQDTTASATPLVISIPGVPVTVIAPSSTFVYGGTVPTPTGTVTGITDPAVTYKFVTAATSTSPIGTYPITVVFSGGTYLNYGFPPAVTATGSPSVVVETPAALAVKANSFTALYGATDINYTAVLTGNVPSDQFTLNYTPPDSSILNVNTYAIVPTLGGNAITAGDYTVTVTNGTLIVNQAPSVVGISATAPSVFAVAPPGCTTLCTPTTDTITIGVGTGIPAGKGTPTGSVVLTDTFTPIITAAPGIGPAAAPVTSTYTLALGAVTFTPTSTTPGIHVYSVAYGGDKNFLPSTTTTSLSVTVDNADFTVSSTTTPISIAPGVIPGGNSAIAGQAAATPEQATITVASILSFTGTVQLSCVPQNPTYVTCTLAPAAVTVPTPASGATSATITSIASISTPATLPLGFVFSSSLRQPLSKTMWAFLPLGALAFCLRRRRRLSKALWMLLAVVLMTAGLNGCGSNSVHYFTPVPAGPQSVTVFATGTEPAPSGAVVTRSFTIPINIQ